MTRFQGTESTPWDIPSGDVADDLPERHRLKFTRTKKRHVLNGQIYQIHLYVIAYHISFLQYLMIPVYLQCFMLPMATNCRKSQPSTVVDIIFDPQGPR